MCCVFRFCIKVFIQTKDYLNIFYVLLVIAKYIMHTYKAQVRVTSTLVTTLIQADNMHNARLLLAKMFGANNLISVLQLN